MCFEGCGSKLPRIFAPSGGVMLLVAAPAWNDARFGSPNAAMAERYRPVTELSTATFQKLMPTPLVKDATGYRRSSRNACQQLEHAIANFRRGVDLQVCRSGRPGLV